MFKFLIIFIMFFQVTNAFTVNQFRTLALEMVDDLEKAYGASYVDNGVSFNLNEYRKLIKTTEILIRNEKIENFYQDKNGSGDIVSIREFVDAVNYFPKEKAIHLYHNSWDEKFKKKQLNDLKVLIHHEFVPYFTKKSDRNHIYSKKLRDIYSHSLSLDNIKPGFYEILFFDDPIFSVTSYFYWVYVSYDQQTKLLSIQYVENPLKDVWCFECYFLPTSYIKVDKSSQDLAYISNLPVTFSPGKEMEKAQGIKDLKVYPYIKMLTEDSFGFGFMDVDYKGNLHQWIDEKSIISKLIVLTRVNDVTEVNWSKDSKKLPMASFRFSGENKSCSEVHSQLIQESVNLCSSFASAIQKGIDFNNCQENKVKVIDVKQGKSKRMFEKFNCAYVGLLEPEFEGVPFPIQERYESVLNKWRYFLEEHNYYSGK